MKEENKRRLGVLIGNLRKYNYMKTHSAKWNQDNFVLLDGKLICSKKMLTGIENGSKCLSDHLIYDQFLNKLGLSFSEDLILEDSLEKWISKFYQAVEFYDRKKADQSIKKIKAYPKSECAYYRHIIECMQFVIDFEFDNKIFTDLYYYMTLAKSIDSEYLKFLVSISVFEINILTNADNKLIMTSLELIKNNNLNDNLYLEFKILIHQVNRQFLTELKLLDECSNLYEKSKNQTRQLKMLVKLLFLEFTMEPKNKPELKLLKIEELIAKVTLPDRLFDEIYLALGVAYYMNEEYKKSFHIIDFAMKRNSNNIFKIAPYYFNSKEKLNLPIDDFNEAVPILSDGEESNEAFYYYYYLKYCKKSSDKELLDYLMNKVSPALLKGVYGIKIVDIFEDEISDLCIRTKTYRCLIEFRKIRKLIQN